MLYLRGCADDATGSTSKKVGGFVKRRAPLRYLLRPVGVDPRLQGRVRAPSLQLHAMLMRVLCPSEGWCISEKVVCLSVTLCLS
jgi:hypothetical protein